MNNLLKNYQEVYCSLHEQAREITELALKVWNFGNYERFEELMNEIYEIRFYQYRLGVEYCNLFIRMLETTKEPKERATLEKIVDKMRRNNKKRKEILVNFDDEVNKLIQ